MTGSLLTGTWTADDGAIYCIRQLGDTPWWAGLSAESPAGAGDFQLGLSFANVFHGQVGGSSISGEWADTPRDINTPVEEARALEGIGRCHIQEGNPGQGAADLRQALAIYRRIGAPEAQRVETTLLN